MSRLARFMARPKKHVPCPLCSGQGKLTQVTLTPRGYPLKHYECSKCGTPWTRARRPK